MKAEDSQRGSTEGKSAAGKARSAAKPMTDAQARKLHHELEVRQIELETQNEQLRRAMAKAEEARERYTELFDFAPVGYVVLDTKGIIRQANLAAASLLGVERAALPGVRLSTFVARGSLQSYRTMLSRSVEGDSAGCEVELTCGIPRVRWLRMEAVASSGGMRRLAVIDISERRQAQEDLQGMEERYHRLFSEMGNGFATHQLVLDAAGKPVDYVTLEVNHRYEKILGVKQTDVVGRKASEFLPPEERELWLGIFAKVALEGSAVHYEIHSPKNDKYFRGCAFTTRMGDFAVQFEDVTTSRRAEYDLARSQAELRAIYENAPVMMCVLDSDRRVLYANRVFTEFTGVTEAELVEGRACGVFGCINAGEDPRGCGFGPNCQDCRLRLAIEDTLQTGCPHREVEYRATLESHGMRRDVVLLGSTVIIPEAGRAKILLCLQDVTERVRAAEALLVSERRFSMAVEASSDGVWEWPDLRVPRWWASPRCYALLGYPTGELDPSLTTFMELLHPDDRDRIREEMSVRLLSPEPFDTEYRLRTKAGEYRWFSARGKVLRDRQGSPAGMIGSIRDISDRKEAENLLRQSEQKFRTLAENFPDIVSRFDRQLRHLYVSPSIAAVTGRPAAAFIGLTNRELGMPGDCVALWDKKLREAIATGSTQRIDFDFPGIEGTRSYSAVVVPEPGSDGTIVSVLSVAHDVTEIREALQRLAASEKDYRLLLDTLQQGILRLDRQGIITFVNPSLVEMLGFAVEEMLGEPFDRFLAPIEAGGTAGLSEQWMAGSRERSESVVLRRDGSTIQVELCAGLLCDDDGRTVSAIVSAVNISDRRKAERELKESHLKLRNLAAHLQHAREEERRKIAQEIHDELGQLLTVQKMDLRWIQKRVNAAMSPIAKRIAGLIELSDQAIQTVQRMAGELRPRMLDDLGLKAATEWLVADFRRRWGITCDLAVQVTESRIGGNSATAIFRIIQEALGNVARHAKASRVSVQLRDQGEAIAIVVKDDGSGISEAQAKDSRSYGLLGIRERVLGLGGEVTIHGEPGKGTIVAVSIPFPRGGALA